MFYMEIAIGILAIGDEVVDGQITNRNASWLAQEMQRLGAHNLYHLSCRDKRDEILYALDFLSQSCHLVIVSGGLGPTSDDCTRQSLSHWLKSPLEFHEPHWGQIKDKLFDRQVTLRDGHRNQAYMPRGATVLDNETGVAPGFFIKADSCFLASLPGPPSELKPMFSNQLKPLILQCLNPKSQRRLRTWICLGAAESEIAHLTDTVLGQEFEIGYRLHKPYVEVKVWVPLNLTTEQSQRLDKLTDTLSPWLVAPTITEIRKKFSKKLSNYYQVCIIDQLTHGLFFEKINEESPIAHLRYQSFERNTQRFFNRQEALTIQKAMAVKDNQLFISLFPETENSALIFLNLEGESVSLPRNIPIHSRLGQLYLIEKCYLKVIASSIQH